eukprot:c1673_g1_i1 orf=432-701(+)
MRNPEPLGSVGPKNVRKGEPIESRKVERTDIHPSLTVESDDFPTDITGFIRGLASTKSRALLGFGQVFGGLEKKMEIVNCPKSIYEKDH